MSINKGLLYVVATPIGNLGDFSIRAREILLAVDCIAVEDTRHSGKLLRHYGIATKTVCLFKHNEARVVPALLSRLAQGQDIALISDAGTPLISDPGAILVTSARERHIELIAIPGPSAVTAALSICGLAVQQYVFEGFLPPQQQRRQRRLESLTEQQRGLVFFEAPHRIAQTLQDCCQVFGGERAASVARELTKVHETVHRGDLAQLTERFQDTSICRGEMVLIIEGRAAPPAAADTEQLRIAKLIKQELPVAKAAALTAQITGGNKNRIYKMLLDRDR